MNMLKHTIMVAVLALSMALSGCGKGSDSAVLAKVNRTKITAADFKRQLEDLAPPMQQAVASDPKARREFLEDLIGIEVVLQEAKRQGLDKDAEFKKRQETLRKELERRLQDDAKNELFNRLLKKELAEKLNKLPQPTDQEVSAFYNANKDKMRGENGQLLRLKDIEPQIKRRLLQEKQRDLYLQYAKDLRAKAKITVDDKALDAAAASLVQPAMPGGLELQTPPAAKEEGKKK